MRDPRIDPQPGDVLSYTTTLKGIETTRKVLSVTPRTVVFSTGQYTIKDWLGAWRRWARGARVQQPSDLDPARPVAAKSIP